MIQRLALLTLACLLAACGGSATPASPGSSPDPAPGAASPAVTATLAPTISAPSTSAPPAALAAPDAFAALPAWLTDAARDGATFEQARAALIEADFLADANEAREADLTGDGLPEWVMRVQDPAAEATVWGPMPGALLVIQSAPAPTLLYQGEVPIEEFNFSAPSLLALADVTNDGSADLLYEFTYCGANTCVQNYHLVTMHGQEALYEGWHSEDDLQPDAYPMPYSEGAVEDGTGDGVVDVVLVGGTVGGAGAGPQRTRIELWSWGGDEMVLAETLYEPSELRYFTLLDGNMALEQGDFVGAIALYEQAAKSEALEESGFAPQEGPLSETGAIQRYAAFRLVLSYLVLDEAADALREVEWLEARFPGDPFAIAARTLYESYQRGNSIQQGCAEATAPLAALPDATGPLAYMGYMSPELTVATLCVGE